MRSVRSDVIGRISLYSFTVFLVFFFLASVSTLMELTPLSTAEPRVAVHSFLVGVTFLFGAIFFFNIEICHRFLVPQRTATYRALTDARVHVGLTAYNDQEAISASVSDFKVNASAHLVIVADNNSTDRTVHAAWEAGADRVVIEHRPGYGSCCMRAMAEAANESDVIVLCEGDMTFSGTDVAKLLAYLENCDLVLGTRATQELRESGTQMDWLINPANQVMAKLIQIRFWGTRLTDVGCTYRAIRTDAYRRLASRLRVTENHFSPHMSIEALKLQMSVIEIPVTFKNRVGLSKGVGSNKLKAARVALKMLRLIYSA